MELIPADVQDIIISLCSTSTLTIKSLLRVSRYIRKFIHERLKELQTTVDYRFVLRFKNLRVKTISIPWSFFSLRPTSKLDDCDIEKLLSYSSEFLIVPERFSEIQQAFFRSNCDKITVEIYSFINSLSRIDHLLSIIMTQECYTVSDIVFNDETKGIISKISRPCYHYLDNPLLVEKITSFWDNIRIVINDKSVRTVPQMSKEENLENTFSYIIDKITSIVEYFHISIEINDIDVFPTIERFALYYSNYGGLCRNFTVIFPLNGKKYDEILGTLWYINNVTLTRITNDRVQLTLILT